MNIIQKTALSLTAFAASAAPALAQEAQSLDARVNEAFASFTSPFVNLIFAPFPGTSFPWIVMWLVVAATIFTQYFGFVQFRFFSHAIALVKGDYSDPDDAGEVSHFRHRRAGGHVLDDPCGSSGHGVQVYRMYAGREIPQRIP